MIDDAIGAAQAAINLDNKFADAYRILGVCHDKKGNKQEARKNLQKAVELGDSISKELLNNIK
jgi:Flp pilus assembly protein TadD